MQIELTDEMIQQLVKDEVKEKVAQFFKEKTTKSLIREYTEQFVRRELEKYNYSQEITNRAKELTTDHVLNKVAERISCDIASAYADKYDY